MDAIFQTLIQKDGEFYVSTGINFSGGAQHKSLSGILEATKDVIRIIIERHLTLNKRLYRAIEDDQPFLKSCEKIFQENYQINVPSVDLIHGKEFNYDVVFGINF